MIVPSTPLELVPVVGVGEPDVVVGVGDDDVGDVLGDGEELVGGVVCLEFDGLAEDGWLAGLDDCPDFAEPAV